DPASLLKSLKALQIPVQMLDPLKKRMFSVSMQISDNPRVFIRLLRQMEIKHPNTNLVWFSLARNVWEKGFWLNFTVGVPGSAQISSSRTIDTLKASLREATGGGLFEGPEIGPTYISRETSFRFLQILGTDDRLPQPVKTFLDRVRRTFRRTPSQLERD